MTISIEATIDAPLDDIWAIISDFKNLMRWHPLVQRCETEGEGEGAVRTVYFADSWASETLELLDNDQHILHYAIVDSSTPSSVGLKGAISLAMGQGSGTKLTWTSGVDPARSDAEALDTYLQHYYPQRIEHLREAIFPSQVGSAGQKWQGLGGVSQDIKIFSKEMMTMSADDRLAIQELSYKYAYFVDNFEPDNWAMIFTTDGILDESEFFDDAKFAGRDAIRAYGAKISDTVNHIVHLTTNHLIFDLTPTKARGTAVSLVETMRKSGERVRFHVKYDDDYVKIDETWLIARRTLRKSFPPETVTVEG